MLAGVLLHDLLTRRATNDGSGPFLTCYVADPGGPHPQRTELSGRSFANWVAKTANLIVDEAGLEPGDRLELRLHRRHPGHWMTLIWTMAAWQAGVSVVDADGDLVVDGPAPGEARPGVPAYACSLHPLGLGAKDLPAGWADFSTNALAQPDVWFGDGPGSPEIPAWDVAGHRVTLAGLMTEKPSSRRELIVDPDSPWTAALRALVAPLLGGGSTVVAEGLEATRLARIALDEKVDA